MSDRVVSFDMNATRSAASAVRASVAPEAAVQVSQQVQGATDVSVVFASLAGSLVAANDLAEKLGTRVEVKADKKGKGTLTIDFMSFEHLDGILERAKLK